MEFTPRIEEKRWQPSWEMRIFEKWLEEGIYKVGLRPRRRLFVIDTPPPYPSGRPWHIGAAAQYSQIDMIARTARMSGRPVYFPIGIDRNGLPVELYVERTYKVSIRDTPRERFIELCSHALDDLESEMIWIMKRMGLSGDFENYYRTDSEEYRKLTQATFIELWKRGLIYTATRPNNYCWECGTTLADAEIDYEEMPAKLVYIKFRVKEDDSILIIATTRPELLVSCRAVIVNPNDNRYSHLHWKHAIVPIYGQEVEIIPHPAAKPEFGSGAVMVCSYGDYMDVLLFRELGLQEVIAINEEGRMTEVTGKYSGMRVVDAREAITRDLEEAGLVVKIEEIIHRTPICERSKTPIEIIPMKEYYLKQLDFVDDLLNVIEKMKFHPPHHKRLLIDWINSLRIDWPISRRRYYATEIPIWYCLKCGEPYVPEPGRYYKPWRDKPPIEKCIKCGGSEFTGEERTFDTWMDSSISPLFISRYMKDRRFFKLSYPNGIRPQGKDIVRTWLYYTILRCYQLTGKHPFYHVWIGGMGLDEYGQKMSKSRGNVIDPIPILEKYGADVFRFWNAQEASLGEDFRISEQRIQNAGKFITKLWNIARYISSFPIPRKVELTPTDKWVLSELSKTIKNSLEGYREFNFFIPATRIRYFTWSIFADHYIELSKARAYGLKGFTPQEQRAAWYTLHTVLKTILILLAPITPFITEEIWRRMYSRKSIHLQRFPKAEWSTRYAAYTEKLVRFNSQVWAMKKQKNLTLKDPINIEIPRDLRIFEKDLIAMHNIQKS
ncbi:MAG: valine--tRNA ligase [Thaumarchaeota archaeon]|jgi:valyl-tRNA synthetase|nr:valine--tRNA ligase [Candidatus Geocrenenecus arthurdayi]MCL7397106.1 valine--tRNA ligase [Candidatus Geocrenenecus arthurdayi]